mgnify:CR=1 FL=1
MNDWITEVIDERSARVFYEVPMLLFAHEPTFVAVPNEMQDKIFNPQKNQRLASIRVKRWILWRNGQPIGRIAAFDHPKPAADERAGAIGFFDVINDEMAAARLFEEADKQLKAWEVDWVDGPIQPGENDQYWGLLVEGFSRPSFGTNWNPPYYRPFFESAGFVPYYEQITNFLDLEKGLPDRFFKIAAWVRQKGKAEVVHFTFKQKGFFAQAVAHIYNHAWQMFDNFKPKTSQEVLHELARLKGVLREDLVWFAFIGQEPAAFMLMLPDLNELFQQNKSKLSGWGALHLWWLNKRWEIKRIKIVVMGVHKTYQKLGMESVLIEAAFHRVRKHYPSVKEVELAWVGDFNEPMKALHQAAGARFLRRHVTFRKALRHDLQVKKFEIKTD